jgi:hypothetical protein
MDYVGAMPFLLVPNIYRSQMGLKRSRQLAADHRKT